MNSSPPGPERHADAVASTAWSRRLGLRVPLVNAPMGGVAGGALAAAVTAAGGLGMIGMGSAGSVPALHRELVHVRETEGRFGIGLVDWVVAAHPDLLDVAIAARPAMISVSFGTDMRWVERVRAAGISTATQVYSAEEAKRAAESGVQVLVARGSEGGGHGAVEQPLRPLLASVLEVVATPVLAAGAITTHADLAAVLAEGASGAWVGTCLAACTESLLAPSGRRALVAARGDDTIVTRAFDVGMELPWPTRFPSRVLRNPFAERWTGREDVLARDAHARADLAAATSAEDPAAVPIDAGTGVGAITAVRSVAEVIESLCATP
ncbi:NAD(P)H-dependent flavin oxidoreductase [Nocardia callitridis]